MFEQVESNFFSSTRGHFENKENDENSKKLEDFEKLKEKFLKYSKNFCYFIDLNDLYVKQRSGFCNCFWFLIDVSFCRGFYGFDVDERLEDIQKTLENISERLEQTKLFKNSDWDKIFEIMAKLETRILENWKKNNKRELKQFYLDKIDDLIERLGLLHENWFELHWIEWLFNLQKKYVNF